MHRPKLRRKATPVPSPIDQAVINHGRERNRRLNRGILTSIGSRAAGAIVPLVMIPLTLRYLGTELYGLWMAVAALTAMAAFADFGLGNGLMTKLPSCYTLNDASAARRHISSAYAMTFAIAATLTFLLIATSRAIPWGAILNASSSASAQHAQSIALVCLVAFLINIPLSLIVRIQYAYQRVAQANIWQACGHLTAIPLVLVAIQVDSPPAVVVASAVAAGPLTNALNATWLFLRQFPELTPSIRHIHRESARSLFALSGRFLLLTIVMSISTSADNLIIARTLGLEAVTTFAVPARLFAQLGLLVSAVNLPLWPANGEALARGDFAWVRRTTRRMTIASALAIAIPSIVLVSTGDHLLSLWLGMGFVATPLLLIGLAAWWGTLAAMSPRFMVQNSAGVVFPQLMGWTLYLLVSVPLKYWMTLEFGLEALPVTGLAAYAALVVPSAVWGYRISLSRSPNHVPET